MIRKEISPRSYRQIKEPSGWLLKEDVEVYRWQDVGDNSR